MDRTDTARESLLAGYLALTASYLCPKHVTQRTSNHVRTLLSINERTVSSILIDVAKCHANSKRFKNTIIVSVGFFSFSPLRVIQQRRHFMTFSCVYFLSGVMVRLTRIHFPRLYILVSLYRPRGDTPGNFIHCTADARCSKSLIIHEQKTMEITPLKEVWMSDPNYHKIR